MPTNATVSVDDVVAADPILRQVIDTAGAARAALTALEREGVKIPLSLIVFARMVDAWRRRSGRPRLPPLACVHRDESIMTPEQIELNAVDWEAPGSPVVVSVPSRETITWVDHRVSFETSARRIGTADACAAQALALAIELNDRTLRPEWTKELRQRVSQIGVTKLGAPRRLHEFAILHPESAMPLSAPLGFMQLNASTLAIVQDIVARDGVRELAGDQ